SSSRTRWASPARRPTAWCSWPTARSSKRRPPRRSSRTRRAPEPRTSSPSSSPTDPHRYAITAQKETHMRRTRALAGIGIATAALLALTGCNSGSPSNPGGTDAGDGGDKPLFEVAKDVTLDGSPTFDKIEKADKVTIGVKEDQPGLGYLDATTGERTGFDVDIARWIAASLGYGEDKIEFKPIASANREQAIVNGDIDYYVGTYSIND